MRQLFGIVLFWVITAGLLTSQTIKVKTPNGGENWPINSKRKITWNASGLTYNIRIFLSKNGVQLGMIKSDLNPNIGYYEWEVGTYEGGKAGIGSGYRIKIKEMGAATMDTSNSPFNIVKKNTFSKVKPTFSKKINNNNLSLAPPKVTLPNKSSKWKEGETGTIRWTTGFKPPFKVELYNYNGTKKVRDCQGTVKNEGGATYSMDWHIPTNVYKWPGNYTIRVSQGSHSGLSEMFHISKALTVKTYTFTAQTDNKYRKKWHKPDKDKFTMQVNPSANDPGPGKARVGYENHNTSDLYTGFIYRSWVFFDVGKLKGKGLVSKATLSFKHFMGCKFTPKVYVLNQKWNGDAKALFTVSCSPVNPSGNLGLIVNGWIAKNDNYGLVFTGLDESFQHNNKNCVDFYEDIKLTVEVIEDGQ